MDNLTALRDPVQLANYKNMAEISNTVCEEGKPAHLHPLGV
jgi:hypothetical protein